MTTASSIQDNFHQVMDNLVRASQKAGRNPASTRLVVVTKTHPVEAVREVVEAGARLLGENYAEEALGKISILESQLPSLEWHMIGHVQSRKSDLVTGRFALIHSVDSLKLAARISRQAAEAGKRQSVLLQVNVSGEESKFGYPARDARDFDILCSDVESMLTFEGIEVCGLMTMPPYADDPEQSRPHFQRLLRVRDELGRAFPSIDWRELSMGMSGDYTVAIEEGATLVRVGTAIMGERSYPA